MKKHPNVTVELEISNRNVDLIQEHFDIAIRIGGADGLEASSLKARKIFSQKLKFVASPAYVAKHEAPETLEASERTIWIVKQVSGNWGRTNQFRRNGADHHPQPSGCLCGEFAQCRAKRHSGR